MNHLASISLLLLGVVGSVVGCKKDEDTKPVPSDQVAARYAEIRCSSIESCCQKHGVAIDGGRCRQALRADIQSNLDDMLNLHVTYDAEAAGACLDAFAAVASCDLDADEDALEEISACERIYHGQQAVGAACTDSDECQEGPGESAYCDQPYDAVTQTTGPGVCKVRKRIVLKHGTQGGPCQRSCGASSCSDVIEEATDAAPLPDPNPGQGIACHRSDNLYCDSNSTCQPLLALGQPCTSYDQCAGDAFCDVGGAVVGTLTCTAPRPLGGACESGSHCQSGRCDTEQWLCVTATITAMECAETID
jgi:hypothetical protein